MVDDLDGNPDRKILSSRIISNILPEGHHPLDGNLVDIDVRGDIVESVQLHFAALTYMSPKNHLIEIILLPSHLPVLVICAPPMLWILRVFFSKCIRSIQY